MPTMIDSDAGVATRDLDDVLRILAYAQHQRDPIQYAINVFLDLRLAVTDA